MKINSLFNNILTLFTAASLCCFSASVKAATSSDHQLDRKVDSITSQFTPEQKIGQLMFVGVSGPKLNKSDKQLLKKMHVGGVILFDWNMKNPKQVTKLNKAIQRKGLFEG